MFSRLSRIRCRILARSVALALIVPASCPCRPVQGVAPYRSLSGNRASAALRRSEEHTSELQSQSNLVCRLLLEKKKKKLQRTSCELRLEASRCQSHLL